MSGGTGVGVTIVDRHPALRLSQRPKSELLIESVGVLRGKKKYPKVLEVCMIENRAHQRLRNASAAIFGNHEDVHQVGKYSAVGHHASECDLSFPDVHAKPQRVPD